ncbi:hypothetical protein M2347_003399 [Chryseobacterium sp. H1D6B]|nr:hypothetical protein [Chryseobacterium sp. H1D6B]
MPIFSKVKTNKKQFHNFKFYYFEPKINNLNFRFFNSILNMSAQETKLRKAEIEDREIIWEMIQQAIERRRLDGSNPVAERISQS